MTVMRVLMTNIQATNSRPTWESWCFVDLTIVGRLALLASADRTNRSLGSGHGNPRRAQSKQSTMMSKAT
jgi:hypothetical protein